jgi:hypothetical protein
MVNTFSIVVHGSLVAGGAKSVHLNYITRFSRKKTSTKKVYTKGGDYPILINFGKEGGLTIEGYFHKNNSFITAMFSQYVDYMDQFTGNTVNISCFNTFLDGQYLMDTFDAPIDPGQITDIKYTIGLTKAGYYYVVK